jgi:hypothetical protein
MPWEISDTPIPVPNVTGDTIRVVRRGAEGTLPGSSTLTMCVVCQVSDYCERHYKDTPPAQSGPVEPKETEISAEDMAYLTAMSNATLFCVIMVCTNRGVEMVRVCSSPDV